MFMRYYPKDVQPISRMKVKHPDRGRKHYWGYERGDYGFYQSEDQEQMKSLKKNLRSHRHARSITVDNYASKHNFEQTFDTNPELPEKSNIEAFVKHENIKLPSLSRISRETQTTPLAYNKIDESLKQPDKSDK